ncbi:MAG: hypothetical protein V3U75_01330 [Methylococcaceae bacterium]
MGLFDDPFKKRFTGKFGLGDIHSEALGISSIERAGSSILGEDTTREISKLADKFDIGRGQLRSLTEDPEELQAPPLSDQEKRIIAQMKQLALGDPELTQLYSDFTLRAIKGEEGVTPGLERDIAEQEAITKEQIARGLGSEGARRSTPGIRRLGRFREGANIAREDARIGAIGRGERLLASGAGRSISAARAALDPLAAQRNLQTQIGLQNVANIRGTQAGQAQLLGQTGTALLTSGK